MRPALNDKAIRVRLPGVILERAAREADRRGMTLSELMRDALRSRVGLQ